MYVMLPASMKESEKKWHTGFFPIISLQEFFLTFKGQLTLQSLVGLRQIPNSLQALMHVIFTCKYEKDWMKNSREKVATLFSPLWPYGSYLLPWKPVLKPICTNIKCNLSPRPNDASDKILIAIHPVVWDIHVWKCERTDTLQLRWAKNVINIFFKAL